MSAEKKNHLVIACGGTGGHFYPTLAIAEAYRGRGNDVTLLISGKHAGEQCALATERGFPNVALPALPLPHSLGELFLFPFRLIRLFWLVRRALRKMASRPTRMLGMGSYAAFPCFFRGLSLPLFLHEGNAFMGLANRMLVRFAKGVGLSLPLTHSAQLHGCPSRLVGMPLRSDLVKAAENGRNDPDFLPSLGLENGRFTILVFGGSQGARDVNRLFASAAPFLKARRQLLQVIHLTGTDENAEWEEAYSSAGIPASVRHADYHIEKCYLASQLVVCRAGASSLCELALFHLPAILIPLPSAADDHQTFNARLAEKIEGAVHLPQKGLTPERLSQEIFSLMDSPEKLSAMGKNLQNVLAHAEAAESMAEFLDEGGR